MVQFVYSLLEKVGFTHPLHPAATHIPMGMVMGCFFFGLIALLLSNQDLRKTALHCSILALVFVFPTIFVGILDWQYFYAGKYTNLIILKMVLAAVLIVLLSVSIKLNLQGASTKTLFIVYALALVCVTGLGFSGGELVYGG